MSNDEPVGKVSDYFWKRDVVRIQVTNGSIEEGDTLHITGEYTDVTLEAADMQVDDETVESAEEGEVFAMPIEPQNRVVLGDQVYKK